MSGPTELLWMLVAGIGQSIMIFLSIGLTWLVVRVLLRASLQHRRIQERSRPKEAFWYELRHTGYTILTGLLLTVVSVHLYARGILVIDVGPIGPMAVIVQCVVYFLLLDAYQYIVHRTMHTKLLFRRVHSVHHRSKTPGPLSAFSFHPVETAALGLYFPVALSCYTFHLYAILAFGLMQFFMNTVPHCGYEVAPAWWYQNRVTRWLLTPLFHDVHHQLSVYNFGACTTIWDRLFGTIQPDFDRRAADFHRQASAKESR